MRRERRASWEAQDLVTSRGRGPRPKRDGAHICSWRPDALLPVRRRLCPPEQRPPRTASTHTVSTPQHSPRTASTPTVSTLHSVHPHGVRPHSIHPHSLQPARCPPSTTSTQHSVHSHRVHPTQRPPGGLQLPPTRLSSSEENGASHHVWKLDSDSGFLWERVVCIPGS